MSELLTLDCAAAGAAIISAHATISVWKNFFPVIIILTLYSSVVFPTSIPPRLAFRPVRFFRMQKLSHHSSAGSTDI
jgi:hypothetical protein